MAFGRHLNVPVVGVMTSKFFDWMNQPMGNPPSTAFVPHVFAHYGQRMSFFERLTNTLVSAYLRSAYWYYTSDQLPIIEKQFGLKLASSSELQKDVALMLVNTHPSFDFIRPMTPAIVEVGGLHIVDSDLDLAPVYINIFEECSKNDVFILLNVKKISIFYVPLIGSQKMAGR